MKNWLVGVLLLALGLAAAQLHPAAVASSEDDGAISDQEEAALAKKPTPTAPSDYPADRGGVYIGLGVGSNRTETTAFVTSAGSLAVAGNGAIPDAAEAPRSARS